MSDDCQLYRLPGATFPLQFELHGEKWELRTFYVEGGGHWRCYLEGPKIWNVDSGHDERQLLAKLRENGVEIHRASFPGTAFRHLATLGLAERVHPSARAS